MAISNLIEDVREMRKGMNEMSRDSKDGAVKMERILSKLDALDKLPGKVESLENRFDHMEVRMSLIEVSTKDIPEIGKRIKLLEDKNIKVMAIIATIVCIIELGFQVVKYLI